VPFRTRWLAWTAVLIAAAVASRAAAAEVKGAAYADLRFGLDYFEDRHSANPSDVNFENHGSYWGLRGSAGRAGVTAFGAVERWIDADARSPFDEDRQAYAGVTGTWGTVSYGTLETAYMVAGRRLDPFFATAAAGVGAPTGQLFGGQSHGLSFLTSDAPAFPFVQGGIAPNQLAYATPAFGGVTLNGAVMFDDGSGDNARDDFAGGVEFNGGGFTLGGQMLDANSDTTTPLTRGNTGLPEDSQAWRAYGAYNGKEFGLGVSAERIDLGASGFLASAADDPDYVMASLWYAVAEGTRIAFSGGLENETPAEGMSYRAGIFHDVVDDFTLSVVYRNFDSNLPGGVDDHVISLGATFLFELTAGGAVD
jgi:hypothetical protein